MNRELSHGLPELITSGQRIMRSDTMSPVLLRGVNRSGLEYSEPNVESFLAAAQMSQDETREIVQGWHSNIVRIPFNQDWCLNGRGVHSAEEYLTSLDQMISWAAEMGAYTILDLQWLDMETAYGTTDDLAKGRVTNHVPPTPNQNTIILWRTLATRYRNEPAVLFDLLNEPHSALDDDPHPLHLVTSDGRVVTSNHSFFSAQEWVRWATLLTKEIRAIRQDGLVLVGGVDWGFDLSEISIDAPNIVYSTHIYANRKPGDWSKAIGRHREVPIFVGEWGGADQDLQFGKNLAAKLRKHGWGWTAWSWTDFPQLIVPPGAPAFEPTRFGALVRNELIACHP